MKRKVLFVFSILMVLAMVIPASAAQSPQVLFPSSAIPQFVQPLPVLDLAGGTMATADGTGSLTVRMCEFDANVLPPGTFAPGVQTTTRVWGYIQGESCPTTAQDTYIGPVILATRGTPTEVTWINDLGDTSTTQVLAYKYSTDQTLHWADPLNGEANMCNHMGGIPEFSSDCAQNYAGPIPAAVHLHGGEVPPEIDGGPDAWYTSDGAYQGHGYYTRDPLNDAPNSAVYAYPNTQEAAPIWFHDHTLGATRLNVFAGLAGAYLLKDDSLSLPGGLTPYGLGDELTVPLVIQDRSFDTNGQLFMPGDSAGGILWAPNPEHPYWVPEFEGDTILVNGKAWPFFNVEPKRYRFLFLNGSNARTYEMFLVDQVSKNIGPSMWVIANDGGYLDNPVMVTKLTMMPGERYEVIIDFSGFEAGVIGPNGVAYSGNWLLKNTAKTPFPAGVSPQGTTTGRVMQFKVGACTSSCGTQDPGYNPAVGGAIRTGHQQTMRLVDPVAGTLAPGVVKQQTRQLTLNEVMGMPQTVIDPVTGALTAYPGGPLEILVNNTKWDGTSPRTYNDFTPITVNGITTYYSELPKEGDTEVWEIINLTADAHPIHLHLVQFQIMNRQNFNTNKYNKAYNAAFPVVPGDPMCTGGVFCPGFGPPLNYNTGNPVALGGNPDITAYLQGKATPPAASEAGWKDTVIAYPGQVTRIAVRWAPTDILTSVAAANLYYPFDPGDGLQHGYVWHCHIIDHEDNEMMRPDVVQLNPDAPGPEFRPLKKGADY